MYQNHLLVQALVQDRVAELRQSATSGFSTRREPRRHHVAGAAKRGTGWLLVDLGLRLAVPRGHANRSAARGPR